MADDAPDWAQPTPQEDTAPDWAQDTHAQNSDAPDWAQDDQHDQGQPQLNAAEALGVGAASSALPTTGGIAGAMAGAGAGAAIGGPFAPATALAGGIAGGLGAGWLTQKAQDFLLDKLGLRDTVSKYEEAAQEQHPLATDIGGALPVAAGFAVNPAATAMQRISSGAVMGGIAGGQQLATGDYDPYQILASTLAGVALPGARPWASSIEQAGAKFGSKFKGTGTGAIQSPAATNPDTPGRPDLKAEASDNASQGTPAPIDDDEFEAVPSKEQQESANDITTVAAGIAHENPPAPQLSGAGNPVGAPMDARTAAKPSDPTRDYSKDAPAKAGAIEAQPSTVISTAPIHEDISAALNPEPEQPLPQQAPIPSAPVETGLEQAGAPQPEPQSVTAPVTETAPEQSPLVKSISDELEQAGMHEAKAKLDSLPPEAQEGVAKQLQEFLGGQQQKEVKAKGRPALEGGITARSNVDLARKKGAIDAIKAATQKFIPDTESIIPTSVADKSALVDRLKAMVDHATQGNGGVEPTSAYKPRVKPPEWQLLRSAQRVIAKPTPKNIRDYVTAENLLRGGDASTAKDVQDTDRIEGDIAHKPAGLENADVASPQNSDQQTFEPLVRQDGKDNTYVDQSNALRDYVNNLPSQDYQTVEQLYDGPGGLRAEVEDALNPDDIKSHFQQAIAATKGKRPGLMDTGAQDTKGIKTKITTAAQLAATEPGAAANAGRSLKGTPDFDRLAAMYGGATAPDRAGRLEAEERSALNPENTNWQTAVEKFKDVMKDETGAATFPPLDWMVKRIKDAASPDADPATQEYAASLPSQFQGMVNRIKDMQMNLRANVLRAAQFKMTPEEKTAIYRAREDGTINQLPPALQGYYHMIDEPMLDRYHAILRDLQDLDDTHDLGLGLPKLSEGVEKQFAPRIRVGKQMWDMADETNVDPITGKTLSDWAGTLQDRQFFGLQPLDAQGKPDLTKPRLLASKDEGGGLNIIRNGAPQGIKNLDPSFEGNVGDQLTLNSKKTGQQPYALDHATVREIAANVKDDNGDPLKYHENLTLALAQALDGSQTVLERQRLLASIKDNPEFQANSTTDKTLAKQRGYDTSSLTQLPQFQKRGGRDLYLPDDMKWAMDDFNSRGYTGRGWNQLNGAAQALIKPMYFFGPFLHALNETDKWVTSRGFDWVPGSGGWKSLAKTGYDAMKEVNTQGPEFREFQQNGGNPMTVHQITRDLVPQFAKALGEDISTNPSKWDPIAARWGVDTKQLMRSMYNASSKPMWTWSDMLGMQKYLENKRLYGMSPAEAAADTNKWIDTYIMPTTVGPNNYFGRQISKTLSTPGVSLFGPYHYGLFHTLANLTSDVVKTPGKVAADGKLTKANTRALGQLMMGAAVMWGLYPLLDKGSQALTGNEDATFGRRGISQIAQGVQDIATGTKPKQALNNDIFTPSIPLNMAEQALRNTDWRGKPIVEQGAGLGQAATEGADWAAREALPPYGTASAAMTKPDASVGSVIGHEAASQVGIHLPSDNEVKYNNKLGKTLDTQMRARTKHPAGAIEELYNALTR